MFQNKLFIVLAVVFALTSIGLGIALVFTIENSKTEEIKTEYNFTGRSVKGAEVSIKEIGPQSIFTCGTEFTVKAPENWYFEGSLPVTVIRQDDVVIYSTSSQLTGSQADGISKFTIACEFAPQNMAYLRISKDNPSDLPENSDYIQIAVAIINPEYDPKVPDDADEDSDTTEDQDKTPETITIKVFFKNTKTDPNVEYCEAVSSVNREIPYTEAVATAAINELIAGPKSEEKSLGFTTQIASDLKLKSLTIKDGVAYADFSAELDEAIGGSCAVSMIRAQITETLKQFSTVNSVVISRNGQVEDILQP